MTQYLIKDTTLIDIANAIRAKTEKSDSILVADMSAEILAIAGTGGNLVVTAPAGAAISASKDSKVYSKTVGADGTATFSGLETGVWTITITNGVQTSTTTVNVVADYNAAIAFFAATINITYPAGSTCTCSDGTTTLTAPDVSGAWTCVVPNIGTWTISITDGNQTKSENVSITADGQSKSLSLSYVLYIFKSGEGAVVPCATIPASADTISVTDTKITFSGDDFAFYTKSKINTQGYTTLRLTGIFPSIDEDTYQGATGLTGFGLSTSVPVADNFGGQPGMVSSKSILTASTKLTSHDCPISGSGSYYVIFAGARSSGEITEICLI